MYADLILYKGNFITLDKLTQNVQAVAVADRKIIAIGDYNKIKLLIGKNTKKMDLKNKTVVPGFIDSHIHLISLGLAMQVLDLQNTVSKSKLLSKLIEIVQETPPRHWVKGYGFNEAALKELPTRWELDKISPNNPIYLEDIESKICIMNSLALDKIFLARELDGVIIERDGSTGNLTGIIRVRNQNLLYEIAKIPTLDPVDETLEESEFEGAIYSACPKLLEVGITSIHELQLPPSGIRAIKKVVHDGKISIRFFLGCDRNKDITFDKYVEEGLGTEPYEHQVKIGMVKLFADGRMPIPEFKKRVREAHEAGYQLTIHSSNSQQVETSIEALEEVLEAYPRENHRHRVEHAHTLNLDQVERIKNADIIISPQPELIYKLNRKYSDNVMAVPMKSLIDRNVIVAGGSDSPTLSARSRAMSPRSYPNPMLGIGFETSRTTLDGSVVQENERIEVEKALRIHTINGAYASFEEDIKGTISVGKLADLVVLSQNPYEVDPKNIKGIKVLMTIIGGRIVYDSME